MVRKTNADENGGEQREEEAVEEHWDGLVILDIRRDAVSGERYSLLGSFGSRCIGRRGTVMVSMVL